MIQPLIPYVHQPLSLKFPSPSNNLPARILLQPLVHNRLPSLPVPTTRVCNSRNCERESTLCHRPTRRSLRLIVVPSDSLHLKLCASTIPSPRCVIHIRRSGKWPRGLGMECLDWKSPWCESITRSASWIVWCRCCYQPSHCISTCCRCWIAVVLFLLHYGKLYFVQYFLESL